MALLAWPCNASNTTSRSREVRISSLDARAFLAFNGLALGGISRQRLVDGVEKLLLLVRLLHEVDRARLDCAHGHSDVAVTADEDDRDRAFISRSLSRSDRPLIRAMRTSRTRQPGRDASNASR